MRKGKHSGRERNGTYPIKDVFAVIEVDQADDRRTIAFNGMHVLSALSQYKVFKEKGTKCVCGLEAKYFAVERTPGPGHSIYNSWHFNLYGVNSRGREVMFTKDHIIASSVGGSDDIENYQPMCMVCNTRKGSIPMEQFKVELYEKYKEDHQYKAHVLEFMNAYYSIKLDDASYFEFMDTSHESELLHQISSVAEVRRINFRQKDIFYIYSSKFKTVHTILDPLKVEEHLRVIPNWGVGHTVECLEIYERVRGEALSDFSSWHNENDAETAEYYKNCKWKNLMFALWKKREGKFNLILWSIVRSEIIKLKNK